MNNHRIIEYKNVSSTNDLCKTMLRRGEKEGTVVLAEEQTRGRGRRKHSWLSLKGLGLYMSVLYRPVDSASAFAFALFPALALCNAIQNHCGVRCCLKWPNDILYNGHKIGGVLSESVFSQNHLMGLVIGIGVNLYHHRADLAALPVKAASIYSITQKKPDKMAFLHEILNQTSRFYEQGRLTVDVKSICKEWNRMCGHLYQTITLKKDRFQVQGIFKGITANGGAIVNINGKDSIHYAADVLVSEKTTCF